MITMSCLDSKNIFYSFIMLYDVRTLVIGFPVENCRYLL